MKPETEITVLVPHRISGFFQIVESGGGRPVDDLSRIGSMGGGPSLSNYGRTNIKIKKYLKPMESSRCTITINGSESTKTARTTFYVFSHYTSLIKRPVDIEIHHEYELPLGAGYGSSGCGAIGSSFGLNYLLNVGLSYNQAGRIAHIAEVMNKTGLGTVGGQLTGGISITTKAGFPFELDRIFCPPDIKIVCGSFGSIPTQSIIGDPLHKSRIKEAGARAMNSLLKNPIFPEFIKISQQFVSDIKILEPADMHEVRELIAELNKLGVFGASMNQLGKSVYCFCRPSEIKIVNEVFNSFTPSFLKELEVCETGPILSRL
ncbi:MAG: pantoate kinase [Promethearchaeota archaeon]